MNFSNPSHEKQTNDWICVRGAKANNLKSINIDLPKNKLIIFTGVSGSGKSSLAFDTIYTEGQRRYLESLHNYARQMLGVLKKPDVELITGLSPAISIDQKSSGFNPRSTVGTITEIYDYLRVFYARLGHVFCPNKHGEIHATTLDEIAKHIFEELAVNTKIIIYAPLFRQKKGEHRDQFSQLHQQGFVRVRVNGVEYRLDDDSWFLDAKNKHDADIIVDRLTITNDDQNKNRFFQAISVASQYANGLIIIHNIDSDKEYEYSQHHACRKCGYNLKNLEPNLFSFNSPMGACDNCKGLGITMQADINLLVEDWALSLNQNAIPFLGEPYSLLFQDVKALCEHYQIKMNVALKNLTSDQLNYIWRGSDVEIPRVIRSDNGNIYNKTDFVEGLLTMIERRYLETKSSNSRQYYEHFMAEKTCDNCHGSRLKQDVLNVKINAETLPTIIQWPINELQVFLKQLVFHGQEAEIANGITNEIVQRLEFLINIGLDYLSLDRRSNTLSGGESQRIRLARQLGTKLSGVIYVLDEPSIGLHQRDNQRLIDMLCSMRNENNTIIVVEHDADTIRNGDFIVEIGPNAGQYGGEVVAAGTLKNFLEFNSLTGQYLSGKKNIARSKYLPVKKFERSITIKGANANNLKNINLCFPLGRLVILTGISGSGKSSFVDEVLYPTLRNYLQLNLEKTIHCKEIKYDSSLKKVVNITQDPIGRTPRSNPATYVGFFDEIRQLFASLPTAKANGFGPGYFSFNTYYGQCEKCQGEGIVRINMHFLPDIDAVCDVCLGSRYKTEVLKIKYLQKSIADILNMTVSTALEFFKAQATIANQLQLLFDVGLDYIKLGQSAPALSGGEAQRIKLAKYLKLRSNGDTLFILDEPTTGLHFEDVNKLLKIFERLLARNDSVFLIEHNIDLIRCADWIIDLGPEGGKNGGKVIAFGDVETIANSKESITGKFLT